MTKQLFPIPTGYLLVDEYSRGPLETLSIGDYGKRHNVKADFLGYTRELEGVPNMDCAPLSEKWVITLSTQYGCPMKCTFCDVPSLPFKGNASFEDLKAQLLAAIRLFPDVSYTERLNLHFARMGDPAYNQAVLDFSRWLWKGKRELASETGLVADVIHPVFTTSSPRKLKALPDRLQEWVEIKNEVYNGQAGLQLSINSTDETQREEMYQGKALSLEEISKMTMNLPDPVGRKYCLNFAYASGYVIDEKKLLGLFDPARFMVKITPIHNNTACATNGIKTLKGYESYTPYREAEERLKTAGYDVLIFVPSMDEEDGLVTCGNAILSGSKMKVDLPFPTRVNAH